MTREEAIEILQGAIKKPNTKDGYLGQAIDMAIKALEQMPCEDAISRKSVYPQNTDMLDKIRAEIKEHRNKTEYIDKYDLVGDCLDIIDKYRKGNKK